MVRVAPAAVSSPFVTLSARTRKLLAGGLVGAAIGAVAAVVAYTRPAVMERAEFWTYDMRARDGAHSEDAAQDIVIIDVGEQDFEDVENNLGLTWPWPRALFGYITDYTSKAGAKAVVFDWIFQDRGTYGASDPEEFAKSLKASGRGVFGLVMTRSPLSDAKPGGRWGAELATYPTRDEALSVAHKLMAWNVRTYLVGPGPTTVLYGGKKSAAEVEATYQRLSSADDLKDLFAPPPAPPPPAGAPAGDAPPPPPAALRTRELTDAELGAELTSEKIVTDRDSWALHPSGLTFPQKKGLDAPLAVLAAAPAHLGNVFQDNETDGLMRRHALLVEHLGRFFPSLALAAYLVAHPTVKPELDGRELVLGDRRIPLDDEGKIAIRFHGGGRIYQHVSAYAVLQSQSLLDEGKPPVVPPETFRNKYVLVSATAYALRDIRVTPVARTHLGAEVHANVLDNLEHNHFVVRVSRTTDAAIAFLLALVLGIGMVATWTAIPYSVVALLATAAGTAAVIGGYWVLAGYLYDGHGIWIAVATPAVGAIALTFGSLLVTSSIERGDRRFAQQALGRYTSPALMRELVAHPKYLSLEWGEKREMSVYFSDIAGFTTISEGLTPERLVALLNDYLTNMTDLVLKHGGVVDKYIGDAVMAFWGAPLPDPDHARKAVVCALAMRRRCEELRPKWEKEYGQSVAARAGVNSGTCIAGNMGSKHKYNYTVMGDMVNLASRLEGANKPYGTYLMISEFTYALVRDVVDTRELDYMTVKGKDKPVRVYEVLGESGQVDELTMRAIEVYEEALLLYRGRSFEKAIETFKKALEIKPTDGPSKMYISRCEHFLAEPPPDGWDGVWHMKEK